jgi:hypothetical protein
MNPVSNKIKADAVHPHSPFTFGTGTASEIFADAQD